MSYSLKLTPFLPLQICLNDVPRHWGPVHEADEAHILSVAASWIMLRKSICRTHCGFLIEWVFFVLRLGWCFRLLGFLCSCCSVVCLTSCSFHWIKIEQRGRWNHIVSHFFFSHIHGSLSYLRLFHGCICIIDICGLSTCPWRLLSLLSPVTISSVPVSHILFSWMLTIFFAQPKILCMSHNARGAICVLRDGFKSDKPNTFAQMDMLVSFISVWLSGLCSVLRMYLLHSWFDEFCMLSSWEETWQLEEPGAGNRKLCCV